MGKSTVSRPNLVAQFAKAGLVLKIRSEPFLNRRMNRDADLIFGLDIRRATGGVSRKEWFEIFPGAEDNVIQVRNVDNDIQQLVLLVSEPERKFTEAVAKYGWRGSATVKPRGKVVSEDAKTWWIERKTPGEKRYFLLGVDERQLFVARLNRPATTVKEAHDSLRNTSLTLAEGKAPGKTVRQGEWFFVWPTEAEKTAITAAVKACRASILKKWPIGAEPGAGGKPRVAGNPHTADELIRMPGTPLEHGFPVRTTETYVRGSVRHRDHATVKFGDWRKVLRNNEAGTPSSLGGGSWID